MAVGKIAHLKLHTEYSLLEGVGKIDEYTSKAKLLEIDALAITDTSMFGVIEFYKKCKKNGIKPIIGLEVYLDGIFSEGEYSLTLIAKNKKGYRNLSKLSSLSYSRFNRRRNKIKYEELMNYSEDLFVLSGGIHSEVIKGLLEYKYSEVRKIIKKFKDDFKDNFYLEILSIKRLENIRKIMKELVEDLNINYIFSNDVYYPNNGDAILQKIMTSIKEGNKLETEHQDILYDDLYLKSYNQMKDSFINFDEEFYQKGIENIYKIVNKCNVDFEFDQFKFPKYDLPEGITEKEYLRKLVYEGLSKKYLNETVEINSSEKEKELKENLKNKNLSNIVERMEYELNIINSMGYNGYFIIVWDFIKFAKENGVYVGPGRGSAAGSLVSYALNITEIDPIKYNLIFERFLNPERISMPDIDIDFDQEQREIVIDYVLNKYGKEHVAHIITFGTLKARAAIRDVGRVLNVDLRKVDKTAKLIPFNMDLTVALEDIESLKSLYNEDEEIKKILDYSLKIEGRVRHASVHAAGLVISKEELDDEIPLYSDGKTPMVSTQYQMKELEELGILKIDFLGLKNLTVLRKTVENIEKTKNEKISLEKIPLEDKKTYKLMTSGDTLGVFQCESFGIRQLMKKMKIEKFDDVTALLALYRPGPLRSGMVDDFIASKNTKAEIKYPDNSLKEILEETYGVILYQEQVMKIANEMADYSLGEADELRRAIGKKIPEIIEQNREKFIKKAVDKGTNEKKAYEIYNLVDKFGGYGFNKSHSAAYALIAYWTAYFKANYTTEFFSAVMSTEMYNIDRLSVFINEAREKGIEILVPDVNLSSYEFSVENNGIRFGMTAIKGIGINFVTEIIEERKTPFMTYEDFVYRMKQKGLNKKHLESLILSGSLDNIPGNRKEKFSSLDKVMDWSQKKYEAEEDLQMILFGGKSQRIGDFYLEKQEEYSQSILLKNEKEYLGIYVSNHPLNAKKKLIEIMDYTKITELGDWRNRNKIGRFNKIRLIGIIKNVNKIVTKMSGEPMAKFELEDFTGSIEIICFPKDFIKFGYKIYEEEIVIIEGHVNQEGNKYHLVLNNINSVDELEENKGLKLYILIDDESQEQVSALKNLIMKNKGDNNVYFAMNTKGKQELVRLNKKYNVNLTKIFLRELIKIVGLKKIRLR
ncbi:MAG: DNA polymerase III subunit alpha [Leptotrichiaceae bacterium]|nr:DNA polymerase III subunit alpha [Leptotrichiaceae bacterium]MBP6280555.1 DNA polymerase III subunit alpha [Leptotrichiaceae bacterium]MBP7100717.1 DNA polymerase III subunit alpha [Leptotrichiaceae bacterium]MBP7725265.1 DNA polymerase III subunit alpha [Leptotrichiaceae bacterium]MBP9629493.1 DNA polymerase III subunit alpha [Leptotrichiaceae bacterium]